MLYRKYGKTGIEVSAIGFGGMRFEEQNDIDYCASLTKAAYDAGINYFDTAPGYEKSEELFGEAFKQMKKTRTQRPFYVSTKTHEAEPCKIRENLETSLERMGLDYIDFYHVWWVLSLDEYYDRKAKGALKEFEKLKDEGLIKHICISTHMTGTDIGQALNDYPFDGILLGYSVTNFAYRDVGLDAAAKLGLGVAVMNPLGGGIIPKNPKLFDFVKTQPEETVVEAALRFLINDTRITISLVGFSTLQHLDEAVSAVDGFKQISADSIGKIRSTLHESFNQLCTACGYCEGKCPQGIPVLKMMDTYDQLSLTGKQIELINRLRWHWGIDLEDDYTQKCTECGACEAACTQKLPICERLKLVHAEVEKFLKAEK